VTGSTWWGLMIATTSFMASLSENVCPPDVTDGTSREDVVRMSGM